MLDIGPMLEEAGFCSVSLKDISCLHFFLSEVLSVSWLPGSKKLTLQHLFITMFCLTTGIEMSSNKSFFFSFNLLSRFLL